VELFSVACITCRAKIQVRSVSAIGQVLACPRCGGMVEIIAPPGWKPPPMAKALPPKDKPKPPAGPVPTAKPPMQTQALPVEADAPATYVAEPVTDDDDPLAALAQQAADRSRKQRKVLVIGGGVVGVALAAAGIRFAVSGPEEIAQSPSTDPPAATATPTKPSPVPTASGSASIVPSGTNPTPSGTPKPTASGTAPAPNATPIPAATPSATAAPTGTGPRVTGPMGTALARVEPPVAPSPQVVVPPQVIVPPVPRPGLMPPSPEAEKRLAAKAPALELTGLSRRESLDLVGRLAAVGVQYDWDWFAPAELKLDEPMTLKAGDTTYDALLTRLLEPIGARFELVGANVLVRAAGTADVAVDYPIDDLAGSDVAAAELYAGLVQLFVAPESWDARGGKGKLVASAGKLSVVQSPTVQRELLAWLDRLRTARGKSTMGSPQSNDSRFVRAQSALEKPVTMNFRPGVPLAEIVAYLNKKTDATLTIDAVALTDAGYVFDAPIGIAVDKTPLAEVLAAICEPRELDFRIVDERTLEITTREALRRRGYVELYDIKPLVTAEISPVELIKRLKADFADAGWTETGGEGVARFDAASGRLILHHHQDAHRRIERFLGELIAELAKVKAGVGAPAPVPAAPAVPPAAVVPRPAGPIMLPAARGVPRVNGPQPSGSTPGRAP